MSRIFSRYTGSPFKVLVATCKVLALGHVGLTHVFSVSSGSGASMLPTFLVAGEEFAISRHYRRGRDVQVGDIIVYAIPTKPGEEGLKRVLGLPGDYVLLNSPDAPGDAMIQVPKGHCYITGDNLPWSLDSRDFGPIPLALIRGKVVARFAWNSWWPPNWFVKIENGLQAPATERRAL